MVVTSVGKRSFRSLLS